MSSLCTLLLPLSEFCLATRLRPQIKEKPSTRTKGFCLHAPFAMGSVTALRLHAQNLAPLTHAPVVLRPEKMGWESLFLVKQAKQTDLTVALVVGGSQGTFGCGRRGLHIWSPKKGNRAREQPPRALPRRRSQRSNGTKSQQPK